MREVLEGKQNGAKIVVVDPRKPGPKGMPTWSSGSFPEPTAPWSGLMNHLIQKGQFDAEFVRQYTVGFGDFRAYAEKFGSGVRIQGDRVPVDTIRRLAELIARKVPRISRICGHSLSTRSTA